jgi:hypothetical protein
VCLSISGILENVECSKKICHYPLCILQRTHDRITPFHSFLSTVRVKTKLGSQSLAKFVAIGLKGRKNPGHGLQVMKHRREQNIGDRYQLEPRLENLFCPHPEAETGDCIIQFTGEVRIDIDPSAPDDAGVLARPRAPGRIAHGPKQDLCLVDLRH